MAFSALELHPTLLRGVEDLGFTKPTPIQSEAIPQALEGRDLLACAATGSGKTAAFLLPILHRLISLPHSTTRALVLAPTRELALQIADDMKDLAKYTGLKVAAVHGGVAMGPQERAFRKGADVIVATPGRLLDHFQYGYARLAGLEYLVLDEADRMLDMGFLPDIKRVLKHVPKPKQTLFFSATMPPAIEKLTREILNNPAKIALQRRAAPAEGVKHALYPVASSLKGSLLVDLFRGRHMNEALVFTRTKHRANRLTKQLVRSGISAERIHGNRSQAQRTKALAGFKSGQFRVLVATDIAARGIDVTELGHVVNFDVPGAPEDYIHRVGRTARAEATGEAFTFVTPEDEGDIARIERVVGGKIPRVYLDGFAYQAAPDARDGGHRSNGGSGQRSNGSSGQRSNGGSGQRSNGNGGGGARQEAQNGSRSAQSKANGESRTRLAGRGSSTGRARSNGASTPAEGGRPRRRRYGKRRD